jgi:hypothetical protein
MMVRPPRRRKLSLGHARRPAFVNSAIAALAVQLDIMPRLVRVAKERINL